MHFRNARTVKSILRPMPSVYVKDKFSAKILLIFAEETHEKIRVTTSMMAFAPSLTRFSSQDTIDLQLSTINVNMQPDYATNMEYAFHLTYFFRSCDRIWYWNPSNPEKTIGNTLYSESVLSEVLASADVQLGSSWLSCTVFKCSVGRLGRIVQAPFTADLYSNRWANAAWTGTNQTEVREMECFGVITKREEVSDDQQHWNGLRSRFMDPEWTLMEKEYI
jgi:hypothetical protein